MSPGRPNILGALAAPLLCLLLAVLAGVPAQARAGDFSNWAVLVVAGDWRSHSGGDTDAFDNARRDVAKALVKAGFDAANITQYSLRPPRAGDPAFVTVDPRIPLEAWEKTAAKATDGCLFYLTSHGSPSGAVFGPGVTLTPFMLSQLLDQTCPGRPTVVIISACFSGVFVDPLAGSQRMVLTAARPDRTSFGCGDKDKYPYFDACVLQSLPEAQSFPKLAVLATACVSKRETDEHLDPHSEPQTYLGGEARAVLPLELLGKP